MSIPLRTRSIVALLAIVATTTVLLPPTSAQASTRPLFQLPFPCGEKWRLGTYYGHDDYDIDMTATSGTTNGRPILASANGTVVYSGWDNGGGWMVKLRHVNGWETMYLHMIERPMVGTGQGVNRGQQLGRVGSTGDSSGPHLHYEQRLNGGKVESWFDGIPSRITSDGSAATGPIYVEGPVSPAVQVVSNNCDYGRTRFADLTGDGRDEIITLGGNGDVVAYRNRGNWDAGDVYAGSDSKLVAKGFTVPMSTSFADLTGDGRAEIIAISGNGDVVAYRNRGNWDAGDVYSGPDSKLVAKGFTDHDSTFFADLTGDTKAEIITLGGNGDVVAYRNRGNWDAGDVYAGGDSKLVAKGFTASERTAFADLTGEGRAEIVTLGGNGDVVAYRNRGNWDAGDVYAGGDSKLVAKGFTSWSRTKFGDLTGEGRDEIVTIGSNGDVVAYRNRGNWDAGDIYSGPDSKLVAKGFGA